MRKITAFLMTLILTGVLLAVPALAESPDGLFASNQQVIDSPEWIAALPAAQEAEQLFVADQRLDCRLRGAVDVVSAIE